MNNNNNNNNKSRLEIEEDEIELIPKRSISPKNRNGLTRGFHNGGAGNYCRNWILAKIFGQEDDNKKDIRKLLITLFLICMVLYFVIDVPLEEETIVNFDDSEYGAIHYQQQQHLSPADQTAQEIDIHETVITEEGTDNNHEQVVITEEGEDKKKQQDDEAIAQNIMDKIRNKYKNGEIDSHPVDKDINNNDDKKDETTKASNSTEVAPSSSVVSEEEEDTSTNITSYVPLRGKEKIIEKWGKWHFWDSSEDLRPKEDYAGKFPNRDIPGSELPSTAWQGDAVYVNHFLDSAIELLARAKESIYTEYGHNGEGLTPDELYMRSKMFQLQTLDLDNDNTDDNNDELIKLARQGGGWTTEKSFDNLQRRLIHAIFTNDSFTIVMGGDANAAGKGGNHFLQSALMQFHKFMNPIFERLNVKLITRNLAHTSPITSSLGSSSIYGDDVDVIIWDDNDDTTKNPELLDLFYRQALLGGNRAPVLILGNYNYDNSSYQDVLKKLYKNTGADIIQLGTAMTGIPTSKTTDQVKTLPYAIQNLKCTNEDKDNICQKKENKFKTQCWVKRDDVNPPTAQIDTIPISEEYQHVAGFKSHRLSGHVLAFQIIEAIYQIMGQWSTNTIHAGHPWSDEYWHIGDLYKNIQEKAKIYTGGLCNSSNSMDFVPKRVCNIPLKSRTEYTPRVNPSSTSLINIINEEGNISKMEEKNLYDGPNVQNPVLYELKEGELDIVTIVSDRRKLELDNDPSLLDSHSNINHSFLRRAKEERTAGSGWKIVNSLPGNCDGIYTSECGRLKSSNCLLAGHMDSKGGVVGKESNGWLLMTLKDMKEGIIMLQLDIGLQTLPDDFEFQFAVNDKTTSWSKAEFEKNLKKVNNGIQVEFVTLLDDEKILKDNDAQNMQLSLRIKNAEDKMSFKITHVYWA